MAFVTANAIPRATGTALLPATTSVAFDLATEPRPTSYERSLIRATSVVVIISSTTESATAPVASSIITALSATPVPAIRPRLLLL